jgi:Xaa-Pro aminopeptidase
VDEAYQTAVDLLKRSLSTGTWPTAKEVDQAARQTLTKVGYANYFIHTTGHGVGITIHEPPSVYWQNAQILATNMVITIEPGVYLPGKFGYRHENTIWLSDSAVSELTS